MISLGSKTWGSSPSIPISFEYEKKRSGASMGYRVKVTISPVSGASYFGYPIYMKLTMDGVLRETVTLKAVSPSRWTSAITYTSPWYWVSNKTTGTTAVSFNIYSGSGESRDYTYTYSMAIDPAASEFVTLANGTLGTAQTITLKKYDSSFTHTIEYACGNIYGTVCTKVADTSIPFTPPLKLAQANTTGTSVSVTLTLITYNSSGTAINSVSKTITCTIPDVAELKPTIEVKITDSSGCFDKYGKYVQGQSSLEVDIDSSGVYGATVKSQSLTFDDRSHTVEEDGIATIENIKGTGDLSLVATVTDSRGRKSTKTIILSVMKYEPPKVTDLVVRRSGRTGTSNPTGEYLAVDYSASVSPLDNKNSAKYYLQYKKVSDADYTIEELTSLNGVYVATGYVSVIEADTGSSYDVKLVVEDDFYQGDEAISKAGLGSSIEVLCSRAAKGMGFAFGKVAEYIESLGKRLEVAWNARFYKDVEVDGKVTTSGIEIDMTEEEATEINTSLGTSGIKRLATFIKNIAYKLGLIADYVVEQGTSGVWTYRKWNSGVAECWGNPSKTVSSSGTYIGMYAFSTSFDLPSGIFKTVTEANVSPRIGSGYAIPAYINAEATRINADALANNSGAQTFAIHANVKGIWK